MSDKNRAEGVISRTYLVNVEVEAKLAEIQAKFGLNKSDSVRRAVVMLHDYLINDKLPQPKIER
jgi:hypothetical protein